MLLALAAGLRRGEIDSLAWPQIDFKRDLIRIEATESASLKTADSRGEVPIDPEVVPILRGFRQRPPDRSSSRRKAENTGRVCGGVTIGPMQCSHG